MLLDYLKSRFQFRLDNATNILIVINLAIWLVVLLLKIPFLLFNVDFHPYFLEVPSDFALFLKTPWTLVTYCFLHTSFWHILFNMLALYWFGHIAEEHFSARQLIIIYILGGIAGGLLFLFAFNTFPFFTARFHNTLLLGASASVLAIVTAAATVDPSRKINFAFIGAVSLKWLAVIMIVVSFLGVTGSNAGGDIAHLGGALLGFVYALLEKYISKKHVRRQNVFTNKDNTSDFHFQRGTRSESHTNSNQSDVEIDRILQKIKQTGYASLTDDEKQKLFKR